MDRNSNASVIVEDGKRCTFDIFSRNETGGGDPCALKPLAQTIAANVSRAMYVAENWTTACENTAGLSLMYPGIGVGILLILMATISALWLSL